MSVPNAVGDVRGELDRLMTTAVAQGVVDDLEIAMLSRAGEYTRFAGDVIHQPQDITETQFLVRAIVDGHAYRSATTVLAHLGASIDLAAAAAREHATRAGRPGSADVAGPQPEPTTGTLWFEDTSAFDAGARVRAARDAMNAAHAAGGEAAGMLGRAVTQQAVVTSRGLQRETTASEASGAVTIDVGDGTAHWIDLSRSADRLSVAQSIEAAIGQAARSRSRIELLPGTYPVVLGAEATGELLQFLPALGFAGEEAAAGIGLVAGARGERVVARAVSVADDVTADVGLPIGFDLEGVTKQRVPFFTAGVVGDAVTDRSVAGRLRSTSTGHAHIAREQVPEPEAANIVMAPGELSEDDLIGGVEHGVYVQRFWYTRLVDRVEGTITGVTRDACFLIEHGRLTAPLAGMRFTQSVLGLLAGVDAVGAQLRSQPVMNVWNGATAAPPIRAAAFRFGTAPLEESR